MQKRLRLLPILLLMMLINLIFTSCATKQLSNNAVVEVGKEVNLVNDNTVAEMNRDENPVEGQDESSKITEIPRESFTALKVSGLNAKDAMAFGAAMQDAGWSPQVTCLGNYCDIGTRNHFETAATIVFLSGHGYVGDPNGYFDYSTLEPEVHEHVVRSAEDTQYYSYNNQSVWSETEEYCNVVSHQQKQITDWLVISACNQLRADTRVSVFDAMKEPSDRPLKGVLGYGSYQGSNRDDLVLKKFVALCLNGSGKKRVAHAWFAAHEAYAPTLSARVRVALRDGFQDDTLTSQGAGSEDASNPIRLWWMSRGDLLTQPNSDIPEEVAVEIEVDEAADNTIAITHIGMADPNDILESQKQAVTAIENDDRIPTDFQLHRTNTIIESDMDGSNEVSVAMLHTFARYINGIRVSVDPEQGEYLNLLMDGTESAELDLVSRHPTKINMDRATMAAKKDLISKEDAVTLGLENSKQLQEENYDYAPEELKLKSIEPVYVVSPSDPQKIVLAWNVIDDQLVYVIIDARSGEVLYWSN